jgi:site-specific recombinase XerD
MRTGLRISEGTKFRVQDFPEKNFGPSCNEWREDWILAGEVPCTIYMGIKGPKVARGSEESVKPRTIYIPLDLIDRMEHYRKEGRPTLIARWVSAGSTRDERERRRKSVKTDLFWLSKRGVPLSNSWLRQAWSSEPTTPWKWSPHMARHLFAVVTLVNYMRGLISHFNMSTTPSVGWLHGLMAGQVQIILTPLMGHMSEETTLLYLTSARGRLIKEFQHPTLKWLDDCESK